MLKYSTKRQRSNKVTIRYKIRFILEIVFRPTGFMHSSPIEILLSETHKSQSRYTHEYILRKTIAVIWKSCTQPKQNAQPPEMMNSCVSSMDARALKTMLQWSGIPCIMHEVAFVLLNVPKVVIFSLPSLIPYFLPALLYFLLIWASLLQPILLCVH